ncbi:MAG: AI-2E family transporter [Candidatus Nealsonbacteria bacterium]|nr:AI-2E family transporter [Candidatus Nealsonbacteria bacterium]
MNSRVLDISWETILKMAIAFFTFYLLYLIRDILVWVTFGLILSVLFNPAIDFLHRKYFPRVFATILVYVLLFGSLSFLIYSVAPIFIIEIEQFSQFFPEYFEKISIPLKSLGIEAFDSFENFTNVLEQGLSNASSNIFSAIGVIFGGIFSAITIFTIALFLSLENKGIEKVLGILAPKRHEALVLSLWERSQKKVSGWFGARILASLFVGIMTYITCYVLNVKYAVSFGLLSAVLNLIPIIGPVVLGAAVVLLIAMTSWTKAIFFLVAFIIIQQIEGNILSPVLTRKFIGLPAVLVLVSLMVGAKLWGLMGALLAIPIAGIMFEFLKDFLKKRKEEKEKPEFL